MTYHLAAFHLRSIGERSARFNNLTLDLTSPAADTGALQPADSVAWLRNGGGKSSLLSLFYALLLPRAVDFMGKTAKRNLTDYIDSGDTSHTVAVWHPVTNQATLLGSPDTILITGAVYEWQDLRRPGDADKARDRLNADYYAFYAVPGVLDLDTLPFTDSAGAPQRRNTFLAALRDAAARNPQAAELVITDRQYQWTSELIARGLDPDLFRTQKQMNHVEGGVEDLFKFSSAREFINFLLDLTINPDEATTVADRLSSITTLIASKPARILERDFCAAAITGLDNVAICSAALNEAVEAAALAEANAHTLAAQFDASIQQAYNAHTDLSQERDLTQAALTTVETERTVSADLQHLYGMRAAELRVTAAKRAVEVAQHAKDEAKFLADGWAATTPLAELSEARELHRLAQEEAAAEHADMAPLRVAHDKAAAALQHRLIQLADAKDAEANTAADLADQNRLEADEYRQRAATARESARDADRAVTAAQTKLAQFASDIDAAVRAGDLPDLHTDPQTHLDALSTIQAQRHAQLDSVQQQRSRRPEQRNKMTRRVAELTSERAHLASDRAHTAATLDALTERHAALSSSERLHDLSEATDDAPVNLWGDAEVLSRRLTSAILQADSDLILQAARRLDDEWTVSEQSRTGLLPTSSDATRVITALTEAAIPSEPGWSHLRALLTTPMLLDALHNPVLARVGTGVVIPTDYRDAANETLTGLDLHTSALVDVFTATQVGELLDQQATSPTTVWQGLHPGMVDEAVAESAATSVRARLTSDQADSDDIRAFRERDRTLHAELNRFLNDCPAGHLDTLTSRIADLDRTLADLDDSITHLTSDIADLDHAEQTDAAAEKDLSAQLTAAAPVLARLETLAVRSRDLNQWRDERARAEREAAATLAEAEKSDQDSQRLLAASAEHAQHAHEARTTSVSYSREAAEITFLDPSPERTVTEDDVTVDVLRHRVREASRAYDVRASQSVLAERVASLSDRVTRAQTVALRIPSDVRDEAQRLLRTPDGQDLDARARAAVTAADAHTDAAAHYGTVHGLLSAAEAASTEIRGRRQRPARALPVQPDDADHADRLAAEQERRNQDAQERRTEYERRLRDLNDALNRHETIMSTFRNLRRGLPEVAAELSVARPYAGDLDMAGREKESVDNTLRATSEAVANAQRDLTRAVADLRVVAGRYPTVSTTSRERLINDAEEVLARSAAQMADRLRLRSEVISDELAGIAKDQDIVAESLAHLVKSTLDTLRKAERYSLLPSTLGAWAGKNMLRIGFDAPGSEADLRTYVNRVIDQRVSEGVKPEGLPLLKDAVHASVGPSGFKVQILKPTQDVTAQREDITLLGKWSGGEKLTVCVALYCTIAALRAVNAGRRDRAGGVLLLDNPIGRASHGSLVRLQRDVAATHGVQLIYTTGVKDPDAVSRFPNVIRLDNRAGRTQNRRYIVPADAGSEPSTAAAGKDVTGIRVSHTDDRRLHLIHPGDRNTI